jgi:hypothetical protein
MVVDWQRTVLSHGDTCSRCLQLIGSGMRPKPCGMADHAIDGTTSVRGDCGMHWIPSLTGCRPFK